MTNTPRRFWLTPSPKLPIVDFIYVGHLPPVSKTGYQIPKDHSFFSSEMPTDDVTVHGAIMSSSLAYVNVPVPDGPYLM